MNENSGRTTPLHSEHRVSYTLMILLTEMTSRSTLNSRICNVSALYRQFNNVIYSSTAACNIFENVREFPRNTPLSAV